MDLNPILKQTLKWITKETHLLNQLIYRNSNQHRSSIHFRKVVLVKRVLTRLKGLDVQSRLMKCKDLDAFEALSILCDTHKVMAMLRTVTSDAFVTLKAVASQTYFMALSLTLSAIMARLNHLAKVVMEQVEASYDHIWPIAQAIHMDKRRAEFKDPEMFRVRSLRSVDSVACYESNADESENPKKWKDSLSMELSSLPEISTSKKQVSSSKKKQKTVTDAEIDDIFKSI